VAFGGVSATGVSVVSQYQIRCVAPAHANGGVIVQVTNPDGVASGP
jgi:hypothetical protein